jgi:hypothetical protein
MTDSTTPARVPAVVPVVKTPRERAVELRLEGVPMDTICDLMNLPEQEVDRYIGDYMAEHATPMQIMTERQIRKLEEADECLKDIMLDRWPVFMQGIEVASDPMPKIKAALGRVKIAEAQNKLLALDKTRVAPPPPKPPESDEDRQTRVMEEVLKRNGLLKRPAADEVVDAKPGQADD